MTIRPSVGGRFYRASRQFAGVLGLSTLLGVPMPAPAQNVPEALRDADLLTRPASRFRQPRNRPAPRMIRLKAQCSRHRIDGQAVLLRSYEGKVTGPTLRVRPGQTLRVRLENRLPAGETECGRSPAPAEVHSAEPHQDPNVPHGFNATNLHTHGLHVSPKGNSDNVLIEIEPGEDFEFAFALPANHPPGTFWYHAHKHGSTAVQLGNGMAGALIVEGGLDDVPAIRQADERIFVFQQIPFSRKPGDTRATVTWEDMRFDDFSRHTTVNGKVKPRIEMLTGEVERWRLVHAGIKEMLDLRLLDAAGVAQDLHVIAVDGLATGRMDVPADKKIHLGPGYRADILFKAPAAGTYLLVKEKESAANALKGKVERSQVLLEVVVKPRRREMALPSRAALRSLAPHSTLANAPIQGRQTVRFDIKGDTCQQRRCVATPSRTCTENLDCLRYMINDRMFSPRRPPRRLVLGRVEEWTITATSGGAHPFHIHVNPFEVFEVDGQRLDPPEWRDTILVSSNSSDIPKTVKFRTKYEVFDGTFVMHCHNLDHEDRGMMEKVEIVN